MSGGLKLLFVTGSLVHGGAERHTITLMNRLAERGHECHAAYVKNDPSQLGRIRLGPAGSVSCLEAKRYLCLPALRRLAGHVRRLRPDAVVAANPYALMYAWLALRLARCGMPLVTVFHSTRLLNLKEWLQMLAYRPLFWSAAAAVFVCDRQMRHWRRRGVSGRRSLVIYNGVDTAHFQCRSHAREARSGLGLAASDFVVGLPAVLRPEKNPVQLVEAVGILRSRGIPAKALMIGDGPERRAVEQRAGELGMGAHVLITGFQQDVRPFVSACDAVALCSFTEAFSMAAIEAMAMGKPVVHSDVGGAAEMIAPGGNGFLFPVGDTLAFADRLSELARPGQAARMGAAARAACVGRFSEQAMMDAYEALLSDLAEEGGMRERQAQGLNARSTG